LKSQEEEDYLLLEIEFKEILKSERVQVHITSISLLKGQTA
jgi:hypothetical protein